ncbi:MAG: hypothetical protein WA459_00155 [Stellaceae bacterium]
MRWLLRLGIASDANSRTSFDQMLVSDPVQWHVAMELAKATADAMINFAIAKSKRVRPLELGGDAFANSPVKASFFARVLTSAGELDYLDSGLAQRVGLRRWKIDPKDWPAPGISDPKLGKVDQVYGPEEQELPWAIALGVGKEAVAAGARVLSQRMGNYLGVVRL